MAKHILFVQLALATVLLLLVASIEAGNTKKNIDYRRMARSAAQNNGRLDIIVSLDSTRHRKRSASTTTSEATEDVVQQLQESLRQAGIGAEGEIKARHLGSMLAFHNADSSLVEFLSNSDLVQSISLDAIATPALRESIPLINGEAPWQVGLSGQGWSVAIFDTGVDTSHPLFAGKSIVEACFSANVEGVSVSSCPNGENTQVGPGSGQECNFSDCYHGTHVAGIALGNSPTLKGVAKDADLITVQVFGRFQCDYGACARTWFSDLIQGMDWIYSIREQHNIAAVSMSIGGGADPNNCDHFTDFYQAIDRLKSVGIATVIASGNAGNADGISSPGCLTNAVTVGSTTKQDTVSGFSNSDDYLDILAPGDGIYSGYPNDRYGYASGTSMATPHVSGAFAVYKSKFPSASVDEITSFFRATGTPIFDTRNNLTFPRLNLLELSGLTCFCHDHGVCENDVCVCFPGWSGADCMTKVCINDCNGHGTCINGECYCDPGYTGSDCAQRDCSNLNNCNNHGVCNDGVCLCNDYYTGPDCSDVIQDDVIRVEQTTDTTWWNQHWFTQASVKLKNLSNQRVSKVVLEADRNWHPTQIWNVDQIANNQVQTPGWMWLPGNPDASFSWGYINNSTEIAQFRVVTVEFAE